MKIKTKIQISGLILVTIVLTISIIGIYFFAAINIKSATNDHIQLMADSRADQAKLYLEGIRGRIYDFSIDETISNCLANITGVHNGTCTKDDLTNNLKNSKLLAINELDVLYIYGEDKIVLSSTREEYNDKDISEEISFIKGSQQTYLSDIYKPDSTTDQLAIKIAAPIKFSGEDIGFMVAEVDLNKFENILLDKKGLKQTGDIYLVDKSGVMQTNSRFYSNTALRQTINNKNFQDCIKDMDNYIDEYGNIEDHIEEISTYNNFSGDKVIGGHSYLEDQELCLINETKTQEINKTLTPVLNYMIVMGVAIILLFILFSNKLLNKMTSPLIKLTNEINHVADGFYKHKFRKSEYDEYDNLSKSIDRITDIIDKHRKEKKDREKEE